MSGPMAWSAPGAQLFGLLRTPRQRSPGEPAFGPACESLHEKPRHRAGCADHAGPGVRTVVRRPVVKEHGRRGPDDEL